MNTRIQFEDIPEFLLIVVEWLLAALIIASLFVPTRADAMPKSWQGTPTVTRHGVTYRVKGKEAAVVRVRAVNKATSKSKTNDCNEIDYEFKYKGRNVKVVSIWSTACTKSVKVLKVHAYLDSMEDARILRGRVHVIATRESDFRWFKEWGNASYERCSKALGCCTTHSTTSCAPSKPSSSCTTSLS